MFKKIIVLILVILFFSKTLGVVNAESLSDLMVKDGSLDQGFLSGIIERGIYKSNDRVFFQSEALYEQSCQSDTQIISETATVNVLKKAVYTKKIITKTNEAKYSWKISFDLSLAFKNICPRGYIATSKINLVSRTGKVYLSDVVGAISLLDDSYFPIEINLH